MLTDLRACKDRSSLAVLLGVSPKELAYTLYRIPNDQKYTSFCISKKNGGTRNISAPNKKLKWIQMKLLDILYRCEDDILDKNKKVPNLHYGFRRGVGIIENAHRHRKQEYVFNLDIKDYFDQFNFGRVRGFFIKDRDFSLDPFIATIIAQIACFDNKLPQGSPCSPHIANLLSQFFDRRMAAYLKRYKCRYSRYADDITISTSLIDFPEKIAVQSGDEQGWSLSPELSDILSRAGFSVNPKKVRMSLRHSCQTVTGLTVNSRPNISREFYLTTRAMCHSLIKTGAITIKPFCENFGENCDSDSAGHKKPKKPLNILEGRLSHIHRVREHYDDRDAKSKREKPTQHWKTLKKFYQYKYFVINPLPTVITEGVSDIIYLKLAISRSKLKLRNLNIGSGDEKHVGVSFLRHSGTAAEVLGLTGGAGNLERFLSQYVKEMRGFHTLSRTNPVLVVTDNDGAGSKVFSKVKSLFGVSINFADPKEWHKIADKLCLVKTGHIGGKTETYIEHYLPKSVLEVELNGKKFSPDNGADNTKYFGKVALASYVRANADDIDFSCFDALVRAIDEAIEATKI